MDVNYILTLWATTNDKTNKQEIHQRTTLIVLENILNN